MNLCPKCNTPLQRETKELLKGVFAEVAVCQTCEEGWFSKLPDDENDALFLRKTFKAGGSLAVRLPKEIVDTLGISEGSEINFKVYPHGVLLKVNGINHKRH
jgi:protein PhnA/antitoxin MazE